MKIEIYTKDDCPWCVKAKALLHHFNFSFIEKKFGRDYTKEDLKELISSTSPTVPQVIINNRVVGGYEALAQYMEEHNIFGIQQ